MSLLKCVDTPTSIRQCIHRPLAYQSHTGFSLYWTQWVRDVVWYMTTLPQKASAHHTLPDLLGVTTTAKLLPILVVSHYILKPLPMTAYLLLDEVITCGKSRWPELCTVLPCEAEVVETNKVSSSLSSKASVSAGVMKGSSTGNLRAAVLMPQITTVYLPCFHCTTDLHLSAERNPTSTAALAGEVLCLRAKHGIHGLGASLFSCRLILMAGHIYA